MPAVDVIVLEKRPRIANSLRTVVNDMPARLIETRTLDDLVSALRKSSSGVCLIDADDHRDVLFQALTECDRRRMRTVLFADDRTLDLIDMANQFGVLGVFAKPAGFCGLKTLIRRVVVSRQRDLANSTGEQPLSAPSR